MQPRSFALLRKNPALACPPKTDPMPMLGFGSKTFWLGGGKMARKRYTSEQIIGYWLNWDYFTSGYSFNVNIDGVCNNYNYTIGVCVDQV